MDCCLTFLQAPQKKYIRMHGNNLHTCRGVQATTYAKGVASAIKDINRAAAALVAQLEGETLAYGYTRGNCDEYITHSQVHNKLCQGSNHNKLQAFYETCSTEHAPCRLRSHGEDCPVRAGHRFACEMEGEAKHFMAIREHAYQEAMDDACPQVEAYPQVEAPDPQAPDPFFDLNEVIEEW